MKKTYHDTSSLKNNLFYKNERNRTNFLVFQSLTKIVEGDIPQKKPKHNISALKKILWSLLESNQGPPDYESDALTI